MTAPVLRKLPLAEQHRTLGARFAPFAGWEMPVQYAGIVKEHRTVRERAGVFDVSHMGRLYVLGPDAGKVLRRTLTYKVDQLAPGEAHYALLCTDNGGIIDDVFVYRIEAERFLVVNNAANAEAGRDSVMRSIDSAAVDVRDEQSATVMLALQGPEAPALLAKIIGPDTPETLGKRRCVEVDFAGATLLVARTGYTGEDGFELIAPVEAGSELLERLVAEGVAPCGLGARDTLRLEAALPLYGNDLDTATDPWQAGLGFAVSLDDGQDFTGREALAAAKEAGPRRRLACIQARSRAIMRAGCPVLHDGKTVASMSSGGFSPTLGTSIGMAYLPVELAKVGTELQVDVRGRPLPAAVVRRPFYRREQSG